MTSLKGSEEILSDFNSFKKLLDLKSQLGRMESCICKTDLETRIHKILGTEKGRSLENELWVPPSADAAKDLQCICHDLEQRQTVGEFTLLEVMPSVIQRIKQVIAKLKASDL